MCHPFKLDDEYVVINNSADFVDPIFFFGWSSSPFYNANHAVFEAWLTDSISIQIQIQAYWNCSQKAKNQEAKYNNSTTIQYKTRNEMQCIAMKKN